MMNKQRLLLTGTAGFIGSNFVRQVCYEKHPYELFSIDKIANSSIMNNIYQHKIHEFYIADICDEHIMDKIFEYVRPELVVHFAAESSVDKSINDPNIFIKSNILGTQILINLALRYKVSKFLQVSTDEVYGSLDSVNTPGWTEESPLDPKNPYSASKAAAEMLVKASGNTHGLPYIITRSCNNFGPRQTADKLIPRVIKHILEDKSIPVYGQGLQVRDWIHVHDNCSAILKLLKDGKIAEIYNISANHELSNIEVVKTICSIMGKGKIEYVTDRLGHDFRYSLDSSKLRRLGWEPKLNFRTALEQTILWNMDNRYFIK